MLTPDYPLDDLLLLSTAEQVQAVGNLARFRILGVLSGRAATVTQLAEYSGLAKGSVSHHLQVLADAGLIRLVRTQKVRGGTQRYWGRTARAFEVAPENPAYHDRSLLLRTVAEDLAAAAPDTGQSLTVQRLRLSAENYQVLSDRIAELVFDMQQRQEPDGDWTNFTVALFRSPVTPTEGTATGGSSS